MKREKTRIAIISDIHGNLLALEAFLNTIEDENVEYIYHLGDAIYLSPYSAECLQILLNNPKVKMILGNYEEYLILGENHPHRIYWKSEFIEHQNQSNLSITEVMREKVKDFPKIICEEIFGVKICFLHYAYDDKSKNYFDIISNANVNDLDKLFKSYDSDIIFYGHEHLSLDLQGKARYINPGSLGCNKNNYAEFVLLEIDKCGYSIKQRKVEYDRNELFKAFEERKIIGSESIIKHYFS